MKTERQASPEDGQFAGPVGLVLFHANGGTKGRGCGASGAGQARIRYGPLCCDGNGLHVGRHTSASTFCPASGCGVGGGRDCENKTSSRPSGGAG